MGAGTIYSKDRLKSCVARSADALHGMTPMRLIKSRQKDAAHLVGVGLHRTHPEMVLIYNWVMQCVAMHANGLWDEDLWREVHERREGAQAGAALQVQEVFEALHIIWHEPYYISCGKWGLDFRIPPDVLVEPSLGNAKAILTHREVKKIKHHTRDFLRGVLANAMVERRARDYVGLEHGWSKDPDARAVTYKAWYSPGGQSLLTGGIWTKAKVHIAYPQVDATCPRCGKEP